MGRIHSLLRVAFFVLPLILCLHTGNTAAAVVLRWTEQPPDRASRKRRTVMSGGIADPDSGNACTVTTVAGDGDDDSKDGVGTTGSSLFRPNDVCRFGASTLFVRRKRLQPHSKLHIPKSYVNRSPPSARLQRPISMSDVRVVCHSMQVNMKAAAPCVDVCRSV